MIYLHNTVLHLVRAFIDCVLLTCLSQDCLITKLGSNAMPFRFKIPENAPASVILQDGTSSNIADACGVQYYVKIFAGESETDHNRAK